MIDVTLQTEDSNNPGDYVYLYLNYSYKMSLSYFLKSILNVKSNA